MQRVINEYLKLKNSFKQLSSSTGGFEAAINDDFLNLKFVVSEWNTYFTFKDNFIKSCEGEKNEQR